jgi:tellurite resistance protein
MSGTWLTSHVPQWASRLAGRFEHQFRPTWPRADPRLRFSIRLATFAIVSAMTPGEKNIVKCLVAVAWADGKVAAPEAGVIEGMLCGFDASDEEERELLSYAKQRRTLSEDAPIKELNREDRELLLANAALLAHADGEQSDAERALLQKLIGLLEFSEADAQQILDSVNDGALTLSSKALEG